MIYNSGFFGKHCDAHYELPLGMPYLVEEQAFQLAIIVNSNLKKVNPNIMDGPYERYGTSEIQLQFRTLYCTVIKEAQNKIHIPTLGRINRYTLIRSGEYC